MLCHQRYVSTGHKEDLKRKNYDSLKNKEDVTMKVTFGVLGAQIDKMMIAPLPLPPCLLGLYIIQGDS